MEENISDILDDSIRKVIELDEVGKTFYSVYSESFMVFIREDLGSEKFYFSTQNQFRERIIEYAAFYRSIVNNELEQKTIDSVLDQYKFICTNDNLSVMRNNVKYNFKYYGFKIKVLSYLYFSIYNETADVWVHEKEIDKIYFDIMDIKIGSDAPIETKKNKDKIMGKSINYEEKIEKKKRKNFFNLIIDNAVYIIMIIIIFLYGIDVIKWPTKDNTIVEYHISNDIDILSSIDLKRSMSVTATHKEELNDIEIKESKVNNYKKITVYIQQSDVSEESKYNKFNSFSKEEKKEHIIDYYGSKYKIANNGYYDYPILMDERYFNYLDKNSIIVATTYEESFIRSSHTDNSKLLGEVGYFSDFYIFGTMDNGWLLGGQFMESEGLTVGWIPATDLFMYAYDMELSEEWRLNFYNYDLTDDDE